jgi:hypothetical protein
MIDLCHVSSNIALDTWILFEAVRFTNGYNQCPSELLRPLREFS